MIQVIINNKAKGKLNRNMVAHFVEEIKSYGSTVICWTETVLVIKTK